MATCTICGSHFANKKCYFCQSSVCTSCIVPADAMGSAITTKCLTCDRKGVKKLGVLTLLKRNKLLLGVVFGFWLFTIFPVPFLHLAGVEATAEILQPVLIATAIMTIPFVFMLIAWQKRAPKEN